MGTSDDSLLKDLNARIDEMIRAGKADNDAWAPIVTDAYDYVFGNQLKNVLYREGWERIQINYLWPAMAQQVAIMAQRRGQIVAQPQEEGDQAAAAFWQPLLRWQYESDLKMSAVAMAASIDAWLHGFYVGKVFWEPRAEWLDDEKRWRGTPRLTLMRPDYFGADPDAEKAEIGEAGYVYGHRRMLVTDAVARWPHAKEKIEAAAREDDAGEDPFVANFVRQADSRTTQTGEKVRETAWESRLAAIVRRVRGTAEAGAGIRGLGFGADDKTGAAAYVTVTEIFFHDGAMKAGKIEQPVPVETLEAQGLVQRTSAGVPIVSQAGAFGLEAGAPLEGKAWPTEVVREWDDEPEWPHGRMVLRVGEDTILNPDPAKQRWAAPQWPYAVGVQFPLPHHWRGLNGPEMALTLQNAVNQDAMHISMYVKYFADPIIKVEPGTVQGDPGNVKIKDKLAARAGAIWKLMTGGSGKVLRETPPPMSQGLLEAYTIHARELQDQTGSQDVSRGRQSGGQPTAREIMMLERASKVRTSMAAGLQDDWIVEVMKRTAWLDQRHMTPGDLVRILGEAGKRLMAAVPAESSKFDVSLQVTTALPYDQERTRLAVAEIYEALGPDGYAILPELLAAFEIENAQGVLGRIGSWRQFQEFMKARAAQAAAQPPAPAAAGVAGAPSEVAPVEELVRAAGAGGGGGAGGGAGEAPLEELVAAAGGSAGAGL
jgi:hypothetical protein